MKLKVAALALVLVAIGVVYVVVFAGPGHAHVDPLDQNRRMCGSADAIKGDELEACVQLAYDLMGRADVTVKDDAARALLKKTCDQAYESGCVALRRFDANKLEFMERRCDGSALPADPSACLDVARRYEDGVGTQPSRPRARAAYDKACQLGATGGCDKASALN